MLKLGPLILRNVLRNRRRSLLTLASTAVSLAVLGLMVALYHRDARGGTGQVIDLSLVESLFSLVGPVAAVYDTLGVVPGRIGGSSPAACSTPI